MKIIFYLLFALACFLISFGFKHIKLKFWHIPLPMVVIIVPLFAIAIVMKLLAIPASYQFASIGKSVMLGSGVLTLLLWARYMIPKLFGGVINFHKTYNSANVDRFPIRILIQYQDKIQLGYKIAFFFGSLLMLYGMFWG